MKILFGVVSVNHIPINEISILSKSVKKHFLINHDVDFVVFSDVENLPNIENVIYINVDNNHTKLTTYYQFQKLLSLNYVNLDEYDFIFVCDSDSVFVNEVLDSDLLTHELSLLSHFGKINAKDLFNQWTDVFELNNDIEHTMGNFFGGSSNVIKQLLEFTNKIWGKYKNHNFSNTGFFSLHSEEVVIIKFLSESNIVEKRLTSSLDYYQSAFLTDFKGNGNLLNNLHNFKLIHDTKYFFKLYDSIF